jgi:tungstate transport system substrate-binding protein
LKFSRRIACVAALAFAAAGGAWAQSTMVMASTTSTEQSGLFKHLLPEFARATGITVKVVAVGTGQAIDMARRGDADVLFVHDRAAEEKYVADGFAPRRYPVMYNDFVRPSSRGATRAAPTRPRSATGRRPAAPAVAAATRSAAAAWARR